MSRTTFDLPELLPVLARGKHRNPRRGGCFMEYASYLAGERWSDHPTCTDPALASLARMVNDCTSDAARGQLVTLIPSVIGLVGDDRRTGIMIAARAASGALPIACEGRQRALAAGLLRCDELLAGRSAERNYEQTEGWPDERPDGRTAATRAVIRDALGFAPAAAAWARQFLARTGPLSPRSVPLMPEAIIRTAVVGIADACVQDPDARLRALLVSAIADCVPPVRATVTARVTAQERELQPAP